MNPYMSYTPYMPQDAYMQDQMALRQRIDNLSQAQQQYKRYGICNRSGSVIYQTERGTGFWYGNGLYSSNGKCVSECRGNYIDCSSGRK